LRERQRLIEWPRASPRGAKADGFVIFCAACDEILAAL